MGKRKFVNILEHFVLGRPVLWTHENLLRRSYKLARYCQDIIGVRGKELGIARDRDLKYRGIIEKLRGQLEEAGSEATSSEAEVVELEERLDQALLAIDGMAWGLNWTEHGQPILEHPDNAERLKKLVEG